MGLSVDDVMNKYFGETNKTAGINDAVNYEAPMDPVKVASDAGIREAETMMKVASHIGDVIGDRVIAKIAESFGYNPEVTKVASLQDILMDTFEKIAEQVGGTTASGAISAQNAEASQNAEEAAHKANFAAHCAIDATTSLAQGDEHTAAQMLSSAHNALEQAQNAANRVDHPAVHAHVAEAAQIVSDAASHVEQHVQAAAQGGAAAAQGMALQ